MNVGRFRHVAPAAAPIRVTDLARWVATLTRDRTPVVTLTRHVAARVDAKYCAATCTGRAAMTVVLRALKRARRDARDEVLIPSYTCYSVAAAVVRAGLRPHIVDISLQTLDFDWTRLQQVDTSRALAIVGTNLYGIPSDMPRLSKFARDRRLFLVDDAAQAFGATVGGRPSGSWGDAGIFSFDKGKNVSAIDGGLIVSNHDHVIRSLEVEMAELPPTPPARILAALVKLVGYVALVPPSLYWIPNSIPQLGLGQTIYDTSYAVERYSRPLAALGVTMLRRLDAFTAARLANAEAMRSRLAGLTTISFVQPPPGSNPVYLRFPLLAADRDARDAIVAALNDAGIGATASYPRSLADLPHLDAYPMDLAVPSSGAAVADRIVTLPTHPLVGPRDIDRTVEVIRAVTEERRPRLRARSAVAR